MICQICNNTNDTNATIGIEEGFRGSRGLAFKLADAGLDGRMVGAGARVDNSGVYNNGMPNAHTLNSTRKSPPPITMATRHEATLQELTTQTITASCTSNSSGCDSRANLPSPHPNPRDSSTSNTPDYQWNQRQKCYMEREISRALEVRVISLDSLYSMMINLIPKTAQRIFLLLF